MWDRTAFGVQLPDGTVVAVPDEATFVGVPVTKPRPLDRALPPDVYAAVAQGHGRGTDVRYQVFAIPPGARLVADGAPARDAQGRLWLLGHPLQPAEVAVA